MLRIWTSRKKNFVWLGDNDVIPVVMHHRDLLQTFLQEHTCMSERGWKET